MKDRYNSDETDRDDIDAIVDDLIAHPTRADEVKALLRHKIRSPETVCVLPRSHAGSLRAQDEGEDLWENLPV